MNTKEYFKSTFGLVRKTARDNGWRVSTRAWYEGGQHELYKMAQAAEKCLNDRQYKGWTPNSRQDMRMEYVNILKSTIIDNGHKQHLRNFYRESCRMTLQYMLV